MYTHTESLLAQNPIDIVLPELPTDNITGTPRPLPTLARTCDELDCEPGYQCQLVVDKAATGSRVPLPTCRPVQCPARCVCVCVCVCVQFITNYCQTLGVMILTQIKHYCHASKVKLIHKFVCLEESNFPDYNHFNYIQA